jgi:hypothetical protein
MRVIPIARPIAYLHPHEADNLRGFCVSLLLLVDVYREILKSNSLLFLPSRAIFKLRLILPTRHNRDFCIPERHAELNINSYIYPSRTHSKHHLKLLDVCNAK